MTSFITLAEAQARLPELIDELIPGEELFITRDGHVIATLVSEPPPSAEPIQPGSAKDQFLYMADDFDVTPEDFKEYLE